MLEVKNINPKIEPSWLAVLKNEFEKPYFLGIKNFLLQEKAAGNVVYPQGSLIFNAFNLTPFNAVKVVILGQDPYHNEGQAHGVSFSVPNGVAIPPSLRNIYKELHADIGMPVPRIGNLEGWAKQGVFLLNAILTVRAGAAASHQKIGWENFTNAVISTLSEHRTGIVFLLWGNFAKSKQALIDTSKHYVLTAGHPSPLSERHFSGCRHFSKTNDLLLQQGLLPIEWGAISITNEYK